MPSIAVLAPVAIPLAGAALIAVFGLAGVPVSRIVAAVAAWATAAAMFAVYVPIRSSIELALGPLGYGSSFDMRIDAVAFAFGLMVSLPAALLLTLQPRDWRESALSLLALAASLAAIEAGGVVLTAIAGATAATLAIVLLETEEPRAARPTWATLLAGWLALAWVGVILQVNGGTAVFAAVPGSAVTVQLFLVVTASVLLISCVFPWRTWPAQLWLRPSLRAAGITIATLYPLGFYVLVRAYELGDGRYPSVWFHAGIAAVGVVAALASAARSQAATTRREFLGEVIPGFGGFAMAAIAVGTPLGLASGLVLLATAAAIIACLALLPDAAGLASLAAVAAAIGLPPSLAFGARVLGISAAFEAGDLFGLIGVAGIAAWALLVAGAARAIGLPGGRGHPLAETSPRVAMAIALVAIAAGPALAALLAGYANPVAGEVMPNLPGGLGGGVASVVTVSSTVAVVALMTPLLVMALITYAIAGTSAIQSHERPPLFRPRVTGVFTSARAYARAVTVPEQYRSILSLRELEVAAASGKPVLWLIALIALGFAVTRL